MILMGHSLEPRDLIALQNSIDSGDAPEGVIQVLTPKQGQILWPTGIQIEGYTKEDLIEAIRKKVFESIDLPDDFPEGLVDEDSFQSIKVLYDAGEVDVDFDRIHTEIQGWLNDTFAELWEIPRQDVQRLVEATLRVGFDGPVSVMALPTSWIK